MSFVLFVSSLYGQKNIEISGSVVEKQSKQPIEFATVIVTSKIDTSLVITGTTTKSDGSFILKTDSVNISIRVSFIGFRNQEIEDIQVEDGKVDLGTLELEEEVWEKVEIRAEESKTTFKLDKRVFNVGKDLSSTGASALEVLNNVPSVNVSIEGDITLRGNAGVQILINGTPSVITNEQSNALGTITADMIDRVEVITNPSAKYEAEGTSGIINIVLKKEERKGINGSMSINGGWPHNHSFGLSLNRRTEKFNLFSQLGVGYRELPHYAENINRDNINNTSIISDGLEYRNETFINVILGTDYHINKYNVITLSGNFAYEIEDQPSETNFTFQDSSGAIDSEWHRKEVTEALNPKYRYELQYKRDFKDSKDHTLLFSALGNFFGKEQSSDFTNVTTLGSLAFGDQRTETRFQEAKHTFKLDYTHPVKEKWTFETGGQYVLNDVSNDYAVTDLVSGEWVTNEGLTNLFEYNQKVLGVYGTGAYEATRWGLKAGLRMEHTDLKTLLTNTGETNDQNFVNLFPSAHASYKFSDLISIQAGYSKRIYRPRLWDLNPFFNIRNNFSYRTGNPELLPEFTDSYELTSIYHLGKLSLNIGGYHLYTTDVIERVSTFEESVNTTKPVNIGTKQSYGIEANGKYMPVKWVTFMGDFNWGYFFREGSFEGTSFDFSGDQWSGKLTSKFKFPKVVDFEVTGHYRSRFRTVQGETYDNLFMNLGLRKKLMKGKGVVNFSVRDVFASRVRESEADQPDFYLYSRRRRGRFFTLGFSYGFGKGEAMEFSGQRRHW